MHEGLQGSARLGGGGPALGHAGALFEQAAFEIGRGARSCRALRHPARAPAPACSPRGGSGLPEGRAALAELGFLALGGSEPRAGGVERLPSLAGGLDGLHLVGGCLADSFEGRFRLVAQVLGLLAGFRRFTLQVAEAILFRQAAGSRGGRFGGGGEAVPAPQVAFLGNEALTGLQQTAQAQAVGLAHHADLAQAALKLLGPGRGRPASGRRPAGRVASPALVSAQWCGAEGLVEASRSSPRPRPKPSRSLLNRDLVDGRPEVAGRGGDELGERARLGLQALRLALGLVEGLAQAVFRLAGACTASRASITDSSAPCAVSSAIAASSRRSSMGRPLSEAESAAISRSSRSFSDRKREARSISSRTARSRAARRALRSEVWA